MKKKNKQSRQTKTIINKISKKSYVRCIFGFDMQLDLYKAFDKLSIIPTINFYVFFMHDTSLVKLLFNLEKCISTDIQLF